MRPIKLRAYRRDPVISKQAPVEIDKMLAAGTLREVVLGVGIADCRGYEEG